MKRRFKLWHLGFLVVIAVLIGYCTHFINTFVLYPERVSLYHLYVSQADFKVMNSGNQRILTPMEKTAPYEMKLEVRPVKIPNKGIQMKMASQVTPELEKYVEVQEVTLKDLEIIKGMLAEVSKDTPDPLERIKRTRAWIVKHITFRYELQQKFEENYEMPPTVETLLQQGMGSEADLATAFAEVLRLQGLPTKIVCGHIFNDQFGLYHTWNEVYVEGWGWIPIDVRRGKVGADSRYIKLYEDVTFNEEGQWDFEAIQLGVERVNW